jgi:hypothetical protein
MARPAAVATQWRRTHISAATIPDKKIEQLCFLLVRAEMLYPERIRESS